jgi:hypothetical protein
MWLLRKFWRALRPSIPWLTAWALVLAAVVLWIGGFGDATSFFLIVLAAATSVVQLFRQVGDSAAQRDQLDRQGQDIRRLADIAQRTQEAQLAHQPAATLNALDLRTNTAGDHLSITRPRTPIVEHAGIVRAEIARLRPPPAPPELGKTSAHLMLAAIAKMQFVNEGEYQKRVAEHEAELSTWLDEVAAALARQHELVQVPLRIGNEGGAPLENGEVTLRLPPGLSPGEEPSMPDGPPRPPKRQDSLGGLGINLDAFYRNTPLDFLPGVTVGSRKLEGPFPSESGERVRYLFPRLLHQRSIDATGDDTLWVEAPSDGEYEIQWQIHASNQASPVEGILRLSLSTLEEEPARFGDLESLVATFWPAEPDDIAD